MTAESIVELKSVEKRFGSFVAVSDINLSLRQGEFFSLLGPSGCGKTTALRIIAGFIEPEVGEIIIDGQLMKNVPPNQRPTNMVFQSYAIFPHLNVGDNVAFGLRKLGLTKDERAKRIGDALAMVELGGLENRAADQLSGGQRQRVALARALVMRPKVLLLDEPLSALDKNLREAMQFELRRLQQSIGITFVMVTHDQYEAMTMSDRIGVMFEGRLAQVARPDEMYAMPCNREVAAFIGGMNFLNAEQTSNDANTLGVNVQGFGALDIKANPNVSTREKKFLVGVRPEQLEIGTSKPESYDATLKGTVTNVAFYGESVHYHVGVDGIEEPLKVAVPNYFHTVDHQEGDMVWVGLRQASVIDLGGSA